jgi:hypothetical protein
VLTLYPEERKSPEKQPEIGCNQPKGRGLQNDREPNEFTFSPDHSPEVLVLYLERPLRDRAHLRDLRGALLIQRLEGSRPHGRLCTLNPSERVQGDQVPAELGRMCGFDVAMDG